MDSGRVMTVVLSWRRFRGRQGTRSAPLDVNDTAGPDISERVVAHSPCDHAVPTAVTPGRPRLPPSAQPPARPLMPVAKTPLANVLSRSASSEASASYSVHHSTNVSPVAVTGASRIVLR